LSNHLQYNPIAEDPIQSGSHFEEFLASIGPSISCMKLTAPRSQGAFRWRSDVVGTQGVSVIRARYSSSWSFASETDYEGLNVAFLTSGAANMTVGTRSVVRTPSSVGLYPIAALRRHEVCPVDGNYAATTLRFEASLVTKVMADILEHQRLTTLDLTPLVDLSTGVGQSLQSLARTIASGLHGEQLLMRSPRALVLLSEATLRLIFENVPHGLIDRLDRGCQEGTPRHIRAAIDYMRANLHLPLAMADVAAAAGVSLRSIELGFRRFLDTTPLAYLRRIRLDAVHAELSLPQNSLLVHEVAAKWGFLHMGHFAAQYRSVFGVSPSETVRRAIFNR
jgi:AraC-like DNA-binding protein